MQKIVIERSGGYEQLQLKTLSDPSPGEGDVLIETDAIGVNYADCIVRMGLYATAKKYVGWPITPGFELSGRVVEAGKAATGLNSGDRVLGLSRFGAYATYVALPRSQVFRVPEGMSMDEAAALPVIFFTAYYPLFELTRIRPGMRALVHSAAGGVGSALTQLLALSGCEVTAVVGSSHKVEASKELGAREVIDKSREDLWARAKDIAPQGFDLVLDANGVSTLGKSYQALARGGRLIIYGFHSMMPKTGGRPNYPKLAYDYLRTPRFNPLSLTEENKSVLAFNLSDLFDRQDLMAEGMQRILDWYAQGRIRLPKITPFALSEAARAHEALESGQTVGKLVLHARAHS